MLRTLVITILVMLGIVVAAVAFAATRSGGRSRPTRYSHNLHDGNGYIGSPNTSHHGHHSHHSDGHSHGDAGGSDAGAGGGDGGGGGGD